MLSDDRTPGEPREATTRSLVFTVAHLGIALVCAGLAWLAWVGMARAEDAGVPVWLLIGSGGLLLLISAYRTRRAELKRRTES